MFESRPIHLFNLLGFPVFLDTGGLLMVGFYLLLGSPGGGLGIATAFLFVCALYGSVLIHELGHSVAGRALGYGSSQILLSAFGGMAMWQGRMSRSRRDQILVSLAGPAVNVAVVLVLGAVLKFGLVPSGLSPTLARLVDSFWWINLMLAAFNLLPMYPLDGGSALRTAMSYRLRGAKLIRVSLAISAAMILLVGAYALSAGQVFLLIILAMIAWSNWVEYQQVRR
jgi:Zn-dependent protease